MTEKQQEIKQKLLALIIRGSVSRNIGINFSSPDSCRDFNSTSKCKRENDVVIVTLCDPGLDDFKLNEWNQAIERANTLLDLIEAERVHESNGPNFFKAMRAIAGNPEAAIHYVTE